MMGIGFPELMIILVIIMIIFGAGKLPEIGSAFGNSIRNFKKSMKEADEIKDDMNVENAVLEADNEKPPAEDSPPASTAQEPEKEKA
ncbi:MAG: twin-arginine translocase TatA/TatE family subunit [Nitrospinales bacterium]